MEGTSTRRDSRLSWPPKQQEKPADDEDIVEIPIGVEVLCCAYSGDGDFFAVGASDGVVRVYNDSTRVRGHTLHGNVVWGSSGTLGFFVLVLQRCCHG